MTQDMAGAAPDGRTATKTISEGQYTREQVPEACRPAQPKGPWQEPALTLTECTRHQGRCAYRQGDLDRCDSCHANWATITGKWGEDRGRHTEQHTRDDEAAAKGAVARAARRKAGVMSDLSGTGGL